MIDDLAARLLDQRVILVSGELDDEAATDLAARLMTLDASGDEPVTVRLSCSRSELDAALVVMDTVDLLGVVSRVACTGRVSGPAVGILAVADERTMHPHATVELREPVTSIEGRLISLGDGAEHVAKRLDQFYARLAAATGKRDAASIADDFRTGRFLDAAEAVEYGLADTVLQPARLDSD